MPDHYTSQSRTSDPGKYGSLLDDLPTDLTGISQVTEGLIYHYFAGQRLYGWVPPRERLPEINTRSMERMLAALLAKDSRPLTEERPYEHRLIGCCRDFALLACAILRQQGQPARLRYGFATYFVQEYWVDHVIVEVWNGSRWQRFDPRIVAQGKRGFDPLDLSPAHFVTGGRAWQMCRSEGADPDRFGMGPKAQRSRGWRFIRERLQLDVAALNKIELLCWDVLAGLTEGVPADEAILDQMAALSLAPDAGALRRRCTEEERWRIPASVHCYHAAVGSSVVNVA